MLYRNLLVGLCLINAASVLAEEIDPVMGNYEGEWRAQSGGMGKLGLQLIALGGDDYEAVFTVEIEGQSQVGRCPAHATREENKTRLTGTLELAGHEKREWSGEIADGQFNGQSRNATLTLKKVKKTSPTMGAKPPEGAVVLFDGTNLEKWRHRNGQPAGWKLLDGAMEVRGGDIFTTETFTDARIHVEFQTPFMPAARGQGRGNSGVYVQGRYEVQVLDSFGLPPRDNEAGGIYSIATPKVNASFPPGEWQTYDITFRAPRFDDSGKMVKPAVITVVHNGATIHDQVEIGRITPGGVDNDMKAPGGLLLQDHGNPVRYRNIWFERLKE